MTQTHRQDRADSRRPLTGPGEPFELISSGPDGASGLVYRHAPRSLRDILISASETATDRDYIVYEGTTLSALEHDRRCRQLAGYLHNEVSVRPGQRVAIAMRNVPEFSIALWALLSIGAVAVPLNAWWSGTELAHAVRHSGSIALIADGERWERLRRDGGDLDLRAVLTTDADSADIERTAPKPTDGDVTPLSAVFAGSVADAFPTVDVGPDDPATIVYTSGTTGSPKGAIHTHRNYSSAVMHNRLHVELARREYAARTHSEPADESVDCSLMTYPLFHIAGLINLFMSMRAHRAKLVLMHHWDPVVAGDLIVSEKVTKALLVPTTLRGLLSQSGRRLAATPDLALRIVAAGGASVPVELINQLRDLFDGRVLPSNGYGLTETTAGVIASGGAEYIDNPTSIGRPLPAMEVRILRPDGAEAEVGQVGEIVVRGPSVCAGYWDNPLESSRSFQDGWFRTGDLGKVDDSGLYYVVDRIKEVIIRGGENIFCPEVEAVLESHPGVLEAGVFAITDEEYGETVGAVVRSAPSADVSAQKLRAYVGERLAYFKVPTQIAVVDHELPRTASGKMLKRDLAALMAARPIHKTH